MTVAFIRMEEYVLPNQNARRTYVNILFTGFISFLLTLDSNSQELGFDAATIFEEVCTAVETDFYDKEKTGIEWSKIKSSFLERAAVARNHDDFAKIVSEMLAFLDSSHTSYFASTNPKRYQLAGIFEWLFSGDRLDLLEYDAIGLEVELIGERFFVRSVYDGMPAQSSGILYGDEIVLVDRAPFHPIKSFLGKAGSTAAVEIRRQASGPTQTLDVNVIKLNGRTMFEDALKASARKVNRNGKSIGYIHVWSYAGEKYHEQVKSIVLMGELKQCDGLVVDLRDGWGGASLEYLNLFRESVAHTVFKSRDGQTTSFGVAWGKPVALLTNERSTSGKELFAYGFKKLKLGPVVGDKTAGAVLAGSPKLLANGDVLYLATSDVLIDGMRLEGVGVEPTHQVARPLMYAEGADPQFEKAIDLLTSPMP